MEPKVGVVILSEIVIKLVYYVLYSRSGHNGTALACSRKSKVNTDIAVRNRNYHTATGNHMPYGITECYLPPGRNDFPAFTPAEAATRLSDPGGMQG